MDPEEQEGPLKPIFPMSPEQNPAKLQRRKKSERKSNMQVSNQNDENNAVSFPSYNSALIGSEDIPRQWVDVASDRQPEELLPESGSVKK